MTVSVTNDYTVIDAFDNATDHDADGSYFGTTNSVNTNLKVQGSAANYYQAKGAGGAGTAGKYNTGWNKNLSSTHLWGWFRNLDFFDTEANGGVRFRVANSGLSNGTAFGEWTVGGIDTLRATVDGYTRVCIDTTRSFDYQTGTPPALTSVDGIGLGGVMTGTASGQNTMFVDQMMTGSKIIVAGGGTTTQGKSSEIADYSKTNGYGVFKDINGVYYVLTGIDFGDAATGSSYFKDGGETWLFEPQNVSNTLYTLTFVANGTGTNDVQFGESNGTGVDKVGYGGNTFIANKAPFRIIATNSNIAVKFYGCAFQNSATAGGTVQLEQANAEAISCLFNSCDEITVRNGALLKKCTIDSSTASATEGAVNLGGADPTANTVRDLQIQNCSKGIKLVGTGNVTYNFRNITFANNTNDVRVDFGAGDTVTINILEGGDTPTIDNVNGSTVNVVNAKTVKVTVRDAVTFQPIQNVRVRLEADTGGDLPAGDTVTITRSVNTATVTHTGHGLKTGDQVVIRGANELEYNGIKTITVTTVNAYTYTVTGTPATPATASKLAHNQDETSYDNTPTTEGTFTGGTGYVIGEVITLNNSGSVTVDAVSAGVVTQFTVNAIPALGGNNAGDVLTQRSSTAAGTGFTLTLDTANLTIQSSAMILNALSDSSGVVQDTGFAYTNPQLVRGVARKSTTTPLYQTAQLPGTITTAGLDLNPYLVSDE